MHVLCRYIIDRCVNVARYMSIRALVLILTLFVLGSDRFTERNIASFTTISCTFYYILNARIDAPDAIGVHMSFILGILSRLRFVTLLSKIVLLPIFILSLKTITYARGTHPYLKD